MKIERIYDFYRESQSIFQCPACGAKMRLRKPASFVCKKNHCYDVSKFGYLNFVPHQKQTKYTKELFESRRMVLEQGFYRPLEECLQAAIGKYFPGKVGLNILDVGCGEGHYTGSMKQAFPDARLFAFDNAKDAIVMAAKKYKDAHWFIGDLTNIPLQTSSMDVILDLFTPSNYGEFTRILKEDGLLLKVIPGKSYLKELRACIRKEGYRQDYSTAPVTDYFSQHMNLEAQETVLYQMEISREQAEAFVEMSPMMFDVPSTDIDIEKLSTLTFEMVVLSGRPRERRRKK